MEATAKLRNCPMSARKVRLIADTVRGMGAEQALGVLKFTRKGSAQHLEKVLTSAIANWQDKYGLEPDEFDLYIKTLLVDQAPMLKRFRPAPYGRAHRIRKHSCHITIVVENRLEAEIDDEMYEEEYEEGVEYEEIEEQNA